MQANRHPQRRQIGHQGVTCLNLLLYRRRSNVDEAVQQLRSQGLEVTGCVCHVGDAGHRKQLVQRTIQVRAGAYTHHSSRFGRVP